MRLTAPSLKQILTKSPNDIVLLSYHRTPFTRAYKGGLSNAYPEQLLAAVLRATLHHNPSLSPSQIQDISIGTVLTPLGGSKVARMAAAHVGFPVSTSVHTVNRACASSVQSLTSIADSIAVGRIDVGIAGGMESMTRNYGSKAIPTELWPDLKSSEIKEARDCISSMGITSENVARRYGVGRREQDEFAVRSHRRAAQAQKKGLGKREIVAVEVEDVDDRGTMTVVDKDHGIRPNSSVKALAELPPAFDEEGTTTAGNSSLMSDGASAILLARRSTAMELGLRPTARFVASSVVGVPPDEMGVGPAYAVPRLLQQTGLQMKDVAVWEINEAFASQAVYCIRELGLEKALEEGKVNPRGGSIALGHPLGATGARLVGGLVGELEEGEIGVATLCVGTGMGMAACVVKE
ncbi:MAG: hypothetical protein OHK93_008307 [Ramalina farinacea]|uniref:acetyl-CoA C-acyltransferase n=1 Tax=Ramalina farinacea TaxID=258253 RepID=A0AA43TWE9_9LECA|nr:hypothetical protein [Ramalina farinacea]